ncbi:MAG TPA: POTRA domain-containing protein [Candidatus Saccharimonadales bacterium]|jgi:outer membrane protein insertion porin family|nr:POTRA domain-containing protein [Candidatus Saccharimonadales bacterium]
MKAHCGQGLRKIVAAALLTGVALSHARAQQENSGQASVPAQQNVTSDAKPVVTEIRILTEDGRVLSQGPAGLPISIGKPVDREQVAQSIRALYRTGGYADVRATSTPIDGGLRIDFVVREQLYFNQVIIHGLVSPPTEASAIAAVQLPLGEPYQPDAVKEGLDRLRELLKEEGLYAAQISADTVPHPPDHQMDVIIKIQSGPRAHIKEIQLKNGTEYRDAEILSRSKLKVGRAVTAAHIQRATSRLRNFLVKRGHLNARAVVRRGDYDAKNHRLPLELEVTEGPRVRIVVAGAKFSGGELKKLVPVYQEGAVDPDLLEEGKRNIRERLERDGYFDADVEYATSTHEVTLASGHKGTEEVITYRVERGDRHTLLGIEITGNHYFNTDLLRGRLLIYPKSFATRGRFSRRLLDADRDSMRNLYLANGFLEAKVDGQALDNYNGKEGALLIRFAIQEGKQTRVATLSIDGTHAFTQAELLGVVASTPDQPYSDFNVETDRDNILALYFNEGFPEARFTATAERINEEANKPASGTGNREQTGAAANTQKKKDDESFADGFVRLVYRIEEGPQTRVRRILLTGYEHTRRGVIRREIRVKPEAPLREGEVVESQRRLYNLGVFNRVTIQPQNPNGTDTNKDIVVLVEEAKRYTLAYGGGFEVQRLASTTNPAGSQVQAAVRGILEISKLNVTGRGDSLSLKLRGSTIEDRALLAYNHPNTFSDPHLNLQVSAYTEKTQDINTFTETRYEGSVEMNDRVTPRTSLQYHYAFRKVLVSNLNKTISPEEIPLFNAPTLVSQFGAGWVRDARDNPADATKGNFNSADFSIADTGIGSSASFLRFFFQNSTYHPIRRRFSFARSIRIGILEPYRDTVSLSFPPPTAAPFPRVIPLPERFFAGGGTSLRGFALNQAGPRDSLGFPVGGQALLILNQEFRFPMRLPYIGTALSGALFYDGGNVYSRLSRVTLRPYSPKPIFFPNSTQCEFNCTNELNYFAHTVGLGFRYGTPVGPIRIDLGYQINRPQFVAPICPKGVATVDCQLGQFGFQATRLPGFQIFFNLGSTF